LERDDQLHRLTQAFAKASGGHGCVVAIGAEAGAGKTALVEYFARARAQQATVYWGSCENLTTPEILLPLRDIARGAGKALDIGLDHVRLFEWVLTLISHPTRTSMLIIEDLHWADTATLDLLRFLCRRIGSARALLLMTYRDEEMGPRSAIRQLLGEANPGSIERLSLPPLSLPAVNQLAARLGRSGGGIFELTAGNPFLVTETLAAADTIPSEAVRDATLARVAGLTAAARQLLEVVSIFPRRAETAMVADLVSGGLDNGLDECIDKSMLMLDGATVRFRHELARLAMEGSLAPTRRRMLHRKVVTELMLRPDGRPGEIAHHAAHADDLPSLLKYSKLAAEHAARAGAPREAASHYLVMLRHREHLTTTVLVEALECYAEQSYLIGDSPTAMTSMTEAAQLRRAARDPIALGRDLMRLTRFAWMCGRRSDAERYVQESIDVLQSEPAGAELAWAYSHLSQLDMLAFHLDSAIDWGEKALTLARQLDQREIVVHALGNVGTARAERDDSESCAELEQAFDLALAGGYHDHVQRAACNLTCIYYWRRDYSASLAQIARGVSYAVARELPHWEAYLRGWRAMIRVDRGEWAAAEEEAQEVSSRLSIADAYRFPALIALARLRVRRGDSDAGLPLEGAGRLSATLSELQRLIYVAATRAERLWLSSEIPGAAAGATNRNVTHAADVTMLRQLHETALARQTTWIAECAALWRYQLGDRDFPAEGLSAPIRDHCENNWRAAAAGWQAQGHPYEQALALSQGDEAAQREALGILDRLGANPAATRLRRLMRLNGATSVPRGPIAETRSNLAGLTRRQAHVLQLVVEGMTNADIAARLCISAKTAEHHVSAIMARLGAASRREAVTAARKLGAIEPKR
jgi:DNA-binding CsgD family transcriptional regulator